MTLLASLSLQGMGEALILEGSADTQVFKIYVEQVLSPGQIVVMDNLSIHLGKKVRQAIEARVVASCFSLLTLQIGRRLKRHSPN